MDDVFDTFCDYRSTIFRILSVKITNYLNRSTRINIQIEERLCLKLKQIQGEQKQCNQQS